ncbi:unnamed protein product [Paramecium octaurelia]|uniref:Uncharacterized protein n=1 Tax=Paramecium octaurelia TaxID=43137 RepID=A0A8S1W553_PAROT|nr:unnamed protein product [Paramecium octaurelia]
MKQYRQLNISFNLGQWLRRSRNFLQSSIQNRIFEGIQI